MNKKIKKWSLWTCSVIAAFCLGVVGLNTATLQNAPVAASAETATYNVNGIRADVDSTPSQLYIVPEDGDGGSFDAGSWAGSWDVTFIFQPDSGTGLTKNGEKLTTTDIKQPGSFFVNLGFTAVNGDVVILDGTWAGTINDKAKEITFNNSSLRFDGSTWQTCTAVSFGSVTASGNANTLTLTSGETITSGKTLNLVSGGVLVNGDDASGRVTSITTTENGITMQANMEDAVADVVFIRGLFTDGSTYYAVSDSYFMWEGTQWRTLVGYTAIIDKATPDTSFSQQATGFYLPIKASTKITDWNTALTVVSGHGLKLNGVPLAGGAIKLDDAIVYVDLGKTANVGDVLTINGLFQYGSGPKILFAPTQALTWNGSAWEHISYTTYDLDALVVHSSSNQAGSATTINSNLYMARADDGWIPVNSWDYKFTYESGANVKKNGLATSYTMKSVGGSLFLEFAGVDVGDIILVQGTFVCAETQTRYVVKESCFKWTGSVWEESSPRYTQTIKNVQQSDIGMAGLNNFYLTLPIRLSIGDWDAFTLISGKGISLNNKKIDNAAIKATSATVYVDIMSEASQGDLLIIDGTYTLTIDGTTEEIVFETPLALEYDDSKPDGPKWIVSDKTLCELGVMTISATSSNGGGGTRADHLYLNSTNYATLPVKGSADGGWSGDGIFAFEKGDGLKVNGNPVTINEIKSIGAELWMGFTGVNVGDVVTLSGTFVNTTYKARYVIEESTFVWLGNKWVDSSTYTLQTVSGVISTRDSNAGGVYLACAGENEKFKVTDGSWSQALTFAEGSGVGVTLEGQQLAVGNQDIKIPNDLYVGLGATANVGDILVIGGTFYSDALKVVYTIPETKFWWLDGKWTTYDQQEVGKVSAINSSASVLNLCPSDGSKFTKTDGSWGEILTFLAGSGAGITLRGEQLAVGNQDIKIPNDLYVGLGTAANVGDILVIGGTFYNANLAVQYIIEETTLVWTGSAWMDSDSVVSVSYGETVEYVEKNGTITLEDVDMGSSFIGWAWGNTVYTAGSQLTVGTENVALTAVSVDFVLKYGASIRLAATAGESGIRFTGMMNTADVEALAQYGITVKEFGILIMPNDKLAANQAPNLTDFTAGSAVLKIKNSGYTEEIGNYTVYYGAMVTVKEKNYARDFAGRGYMVVTVNGEEMLLYTPFSSDNIRSVRTVATAFREDTSTPTQEGELRYNELSAERKAIVDTYADSADYQAAVPAKAAQATMQEGYAAAYVVNANGKENQVGSATQRKE